VKRMISVLICIFALTFVTISSGQAMADEALKKDLLKNINSLWQAWKDYNPEPFKQLMSQDGATITTGGSTNLSDFLKQLSNKQCQVKSFSIDEAGARLTRIDDNTYVITYKAEQDATCAGAKSPSPVTVSEVWSKKDGKWKAYLYQETPLQSN
jgi:uncharacterized protein (TIGR02246 family)